MKSLIYFRNKLLIIIITSCLLTPLIIQYQQTFETIKTVKKQHQQIQILLKTYQTTLNHKTSVETLIKSITNTVKGSIIKNQIKNKTQYIRINVQEKNKNLIPIITLLKRSYVPINDMAIDLLNQTIELNIPLK
ncbi:hypothetical protein CL658_05720 [bacterium]|nr:hypothetical protein [bacterium]|tara:strand:+ start:4095 stop:4496 length:402 start_codon:yes stop_codon:yes gene_type:complete